MKYKPLTEKQIIISIDRLTRFKPTEEKYLRVFKDIIVSNLIEPKYKKNDLDYFSYAEIRDIATEIFNSSLQEDNTNDLTINLRLKDYENEIFINNSQVNDLLENKLDYKSAINLLKQDIPQNLKWLKCLQEPIDIKEQREEKQLLFPISCVVIVEGITEEILLPEFSKKLNYDFNKYGVKIIPAGGKNQVVKLYYSLSEILKLPIFVLLDKDAFENSELINSKLRAQDKVYLLNSGEFEDILPKELIINTINSDLQNFASITISDLNREEPMVKILEDIFKEKGLHEFKKSEFATLVKSQIGSVDDISDEIKYIVLNIKNISNEENKSLI